MAIGPLFEDIVNDKQVHVVIEIFCKDIANYKGFIIIIIIIIAKL